ncbi:major facilitator superfamily domain-containing protein [Rhexocercosporidium sp. MPI-PUGE-AT-0058]|nr:major facilitator superfamily domain-containing protein [Rhexocercosporidium sp. MPI-PUGE-AT-0058]
MVSRQISPDQMATIELVSPNTLRPHSHHEKEQLPTNPLTITPSEPSIQRPSLFNSPPTSPITSFTAYPDGGIRAYTVLFGTWCALLPTSGMLTTTGSLQTHILTHQLNGRTEAEVGWIFSVYAFLFFFGGIVGGSAFDKYGLRVMLIPGSIGLVASIIILANCTEYYQFMLGFSILGGTSSSLIWTSTIATIGHWFSMRRGLATGLATTAGGIGGVIFPLLLNTLIPRLGFPWSIRIIALFSTFSCGTGILLTSTRIPPSISQKPLFDMTGFKDTCFSLTVAAIFLIDLAVVLPPAYLPAYALDHGYTTASATHLLVFLNAATVLGRGLPGILADRLGRFNIMIISSTLSTLAIFLLWLLSSSSVATLIAFTLIFGIFSGTAYSLTPVCVAQLCSTEEYATKYGTAYGIVSFATLIGNPIAGAILGGGEGKKYRELIVFCGGVYAASTVLFVLARAKGGGWKVRKTF